jgi:peptidoglycan/xylan/chitin deacetylase (PgdA/CDA1 family)
MPVLERHVAPATFFLNGASLERPFAFWWERLQRRGIAETWIRERSRLMEGEADGPPTISASPLQSRHCLLGGAASS